MDLDHCDCGHSVHVHRWKAKWPCGKCDCAALSISRDDDRATTPPIRWWRFQPRSNR